MVIFMRKIDCAHQKNLENASQTMKYKIFVFFQLFLLGFST
jgi:hypothetical protein